MKLNQQVIVHSTDEITEYLGAKLDVERLASHIKVESELPSGMVMISRGQAAPEEAYQDALWLELDEENNPLSLKSYNGTDCVVISPYKAVRATLDKQYIQLGAGAVEHFCASGNTWVESLGFTAGIEFKFALPYKVDQLPLVIIVPKKSTVHQNGPLVAGDIDSTAENFTAPRHFDWCLGTVTNTGFTIWTRTWEIIPSSAPLNFTFHYQAIGILDS